MEDLYFKDVFTKTETGIDMEANRLDITCIHSNQNKFDLDSDGNLSVKSLTTIDNLPTQINFDLIYPIGSIYLTINSTNPSTLFGGTWVPFGSGRTLVGVDSTQTEFNQVEKTGGEKNHTLSLAEMPSHGHYMENKQYLYVSGANEGVGVTGVGMQDNGWWHESWKGCTNFQPEGNNQSHNNLSPYITCYMWKRTA